MTDQEPAALEVHNCSEHGIMRATASGICAICTRLTTFLPDQIVCSFCGTFMKDEDWSKHLKIAHNIE